jgi:hypothetical protein
MRMMKRRQEGMGWTAMLVFTGAAMTTFLVSANTLAGHEANDEGTAMQVRFEEPEGVARDDPVSSTEEDSARPSNAPALPVDSNAPWRRCGNIGNMMLDLDNLCQYAGAGAMQATSAAMVSPQ